MGQSKPIFYNALLLTGVNLLLRFVSTSFQVYLSGRIGAAGIGLLQLVLSVGALAITAGMGGIRTATMYLCAEVVGQRKQDQMSWVLSGCILYSLGLSFAAAGLLYIFAPQIAAEWIGDTAVTSAIRLLACFLPVNCLCGVMIGHFTAINRITTLAAIEVAEQLGTMLFTVLLLHFWADQDTVRSCHAVILGGGFGACFTLLCLLTLKRRSAQRMGARISVRKKLWDTAVPLAIADNVKAGITTTENLMVPKRLSLCPGENAPLAAFGMVCGMVFPVLMFPAAILFGLAELLIPELARCNAAGSTTRIRYLTERSFQLALFYGCLCGGILFISADFLCEKLYHTPEAGKLLRLFASLAPMLYCDAITDAMTKGLGQQKISVRYNIFTSALDVALLFILLPRYGMSGYFLSFLITHLLNFILSIRLLRKLVGRIIPFQTAILTSAAALCATGIGWMFPGRLKIPVLMSVFFSLLVLFRIVKKEDYQWLKGLVRIEKHLL